MKLGQILVATDFSEAGRYAVTEATGWAQRYRSPLHVVHVVPPKRWFAGIFRTPESLHDVACEQAAAALKRIADSIDSTHIPHISIGVLEGAAARTIARAARELHAELLVIGARGEHQSENDQTNLGGTAAKIVYEPPVPLLLVRREPAALSPAVLAPVDLTEASSSVIQWALRCSHSGELRTLHVYEVPFARRLRSYGVADSAIRLYAEEEHAKRVGQLAALIRQSSPPSTLRIEQIVERADSAQVLLRHIRRFTGTTLVLGKHLADSERTGPNYEGVCDYAARFCPANVLIAPFLAAR